MLDHVEPTLVIGPAVTTAKLGNLQVAVDDDVTIPCLAQGYPVPEIRSQLIRNPNLTR